MPETLAPTSPPATETTAAPPGAGAPHLLAPHTFAEWATEGRWKPYAYQTWLSARLAEIIRKGNGRVIINAPPRHGKSELATFWTSAWFLENWPDRKVIISSYSAELATGKFGRDLHHLFRQTPHLQTKPTPREGGRARWHTTEGGSVVTAGIHGSLTGLGGDLLILDDPIKNNDIANSLVHRQRLIDWFNTTFLTRAEPGATVIVVMARWNDSDIVAWLRDHHHDPWEVISLPAVAMEKDVMGRAPGEPLCPERYPSEKLESMRQSGEYSGVWAAMYQQHPTAQQLGRVYESFEDANVDSTMTLDPKLPLQLSLDFNINPGMHACLGQYLPEQGRFNCIKVIHEPALSVRGVLRRLADWIATLKATKPAPGSPGSLGILHSSASARAPNDHSPRHTTLANAPNTTHQDAPQPFPFPLLEIFGDATGQQRWAGTSESCYVVITNWLEAKGWPHRLRLAKSNPPVRQRVDAVNLAMCDLNDTRRYFIHPSCKPLIADYREIWWDHTGRPTHHDKHRSHAADAEGYRIHYLQPVQPTRKPTPHQPQRVGY